MAGEFAISEAPIAAGSVTAAAAVTVFHTVKVPAESIKFRYGERYISEAANKKFLGIPRGVYLGFIPSFSGNLLHLDPDPIYGVSLARLNSSDGTNHPLDVLIEDRITLDFTGHNVFHVYVVLRVKGALGLPHSAEIITQTAAPVDPTEIKLCVVTAIGAVAYDDPANRDSPYAHSSAPLGFGFMRDGAVEQLLAAVDMVAEIEAAREDLTGFIHPTLADRLTADASGAAVAQRLAKETIAVRGIDFVVTSPASTFNVSASFSAFHRSLAGLELPETFAGFASEDRIGAITNGTLPDPAPAGAVSDEQRNVCAVVDATTLARFVADDQTVAYGRLRCSEISLTGSVQTTTGLTAVTGVGTLFLSEVQVGDIIELANGDFIEVASIADDLNLTLSQPATASNTTTATVRRRFLLEIVRRDGALDSDVTPYTLQSGTNVRFFFTAWRALDVGRFDAAHYLWQHFERPEVPDATTVLAGKALLATAAPEGKAGAVWEVRRLGTRVGINHIHTIDFNGVTDAGGGIANVTQRGPVGPPGNPGAGGAPGPVGPQGPTGQGFDISTPFVESSLFDHTALGPGAAYSFTTTFPGSQVLFLTGGNSEWYSPFTFDGDDYWTIENIVIVSGTTCRLDARVPLGATPSAQVRFYLNAATKA